MYGVQQCSTAISRRLNLGIQLLPNHIYRVTEQLVKNLPLTSEQKFRFGLACPDLARPKRNFCFEVNGRFCTI